MCSSSSSLSSSGYGLIVEGIPLGSGGQFRPRLTMKRIYDTKCFRPERYRHEVANHYRDYKLQQHLQQQHQQQRHHQRGHQRRRRRRQLFGGAASRVSGSLASQYASQFRDVWPTHCHYFPRSNDDDDNDDTSRGEATYNDAVRRIRSAHSCDQLRHLVQRQLERHRRSDEALATEPLGGSQSRRLVDYKLNIHKQRGKESPQSATRTGTRAQQVQVDFYAYVQLASGYYERGLQADLKYLQSIGQQQQLKHKQQQQQQRRCNAIKSLEEDVSLVCRSESPVQRLTGRLVTLLKSLRRKAAVQRQAGHPEIRVNIRSIKREKQQKQQEEQEQQEANEEQQQQEQQQEEQQQQEEEQQQQEEEQQQQEEQQEQQEQQQQQQEQQQDLQDTEEQQEPDEEQQEQLELGSMCDYYAKAEAATTEAVGSLESPSRASVATFANQRRLYEIIDNLSHLNIAGDTAAAAGGGGGGGGGGQVLQLTLPQITLTDCSYSDSIVTLQMMSNSEASLDLRAT